MIIWLSIPIDNGGSGFFCPYYRLTILISFIEGGFLFYPFRIPSHYIRPVPRVLRIVNRFNLGGPTYNACYLTKYLAPEYETLLIGGQKEAQEASSEFIPQSLGVDYAILPEIQRSINYSQDRKAYRAIKTLIQEFKPDIVHTHASKAGALGRLAAAACNVDVIVHTFHGTVFEGYFGWVKSSIYKEAERYLARKSDAIVAISPLQKRDLVEKHRIAPEYNVEMIPLGFELGRFSENQDQKRLDFRAEHGLRETDVAVGIIGRLTPIKDHSFFLRALDRLRRENPNVKTFVIGGGELESQVEDQAAELGFTKGKDIVFTSWIEDVSYPLAGLDVVALTSINEGTPVSLIEAQAAQCSVISLDVGGVKDVVLNGETGFVTNKEGFSSKLNELIRNPELRNQMGVKGRKHALSKYSVDRLAQDMRSLYGRLLTT